MQFDDRSSDEQNSNNCPGTAHSLGAQLRDKEERKTIQ